MRLTPQILCLIKLFLHYDIELFKHKLNKIEYIKTKINILIQVFFLIKFKILIYLYKVDDAFLIETGLELGGIAGPVCLL